MAKEATLEFLKCALKPKFDVELSSYTPPGVTSKRGIRTPPLRFKSRFNVTSAKV